MVVDRGEQEMRYVPLRESCSKSKNKWNFFGPSISHPETSQIVLCASPSRKEPLFKMTNVTQAYAIFPGPSDQAGGATPIKVQGRYTPGRRAPKDGWMLVLPDLPKSAAPKPIVETLKWTVGKSACDPLRYPAHIFGFTGIHDAFGLYGRPVSYRWSRYDPYSLLFASPEGADADVSALVRVTASYAHSQMQQLFLSRESAEILPTGESRTSVIHAQLADILVEEIWAQTPSFEEMRLIDSPLDEYSSTVSFASTRFGDSPTLCEDDSPSKETPNEADHPDRQGIPEMDLADHFGTPGRHSGYEVGVREGTVRILYY
jgi:hypothetical protein